MTWSTFEHPADVGLELSAASGAELFAEAGLAYFSLVCDVGAVEERERYPVSGEAGDAEALLVDWLNELIFVFGGDRVVCRRIDVTSWSRTAYTAILHGEPIDQSRHAPRDLVKAATYHGVSVASRADGWHARVILDV